MREQVHQAIAALVGLPLWSLGRAADLAWFHFGSRRTVKGWKGVEKQVGDYALHVQCAWRITLGEKVVTGRGDIFRTPEETDEPTPPDFDWQKGNRFDRVVHQLFPNESSQFTVLSADAGDAGSLTLVLSGGYKLELFPQHSQSCEHWRFFKPYSNEPHLVIRGKGLQAE